MEILDMIAEWRKGCTVAGPMRDSIYKEGTPTSPCECIDCTEGLINAIERKLLAEKALDDILGSCEVCNNSITRREYAEFEGKTYHQVCLPKEAL